MVIGNEPVWIDIDCTGGSGNRYFGRFLIKKYLNHAERAASVRVAEMLCRGINQDVAFRTLLSTVAFLNQHILETDAKWWTSSNESPDDVKGMNLLDEEPIWILASKINEAQKPKTENPE